MIDDFPAVDEEKKIGALIKTSLVDYPGRVAAALFLQGCNLRCPYCYNTELVTGTPEDYEAVSFKQVIEHLKKRAAVLTGFVISGGEPLLSPCLPRLISEARALGYYIKLDTNGLMFERLERIITDPQLCPDYIALDVKTSPDRYADLGGAHSPAGQMSAQNKIKKAIELVSSLSADKREFRTVLVPPLVSKPDIDSIAKLLPSDASWYFAQFRNENCLDPSYNDITPYTDEQVQKLVFFAKEKIPNSALR
ncbi:MAG TPA: anaerobic ribonucleoside-triphosphate reductase activating protein [Treponemataceae bacterium]|jgi:pyruvate formate lyase activating enzyme|nr:anaerobic ribonucleoside-triphosphate reductase activating protein [Treponemataceae bacterium]